MPLFFLINNSLIRSKWLYCCTIHGFPNFPVKTITKWKQTAIIRSSIYSFSYISTVNLWYLLNFIILYLYLCISCTITLNSIDSPRLATGGCGVWFYVHLFCFELTTATWPVLISHHAHSQRRTIWESPISLTARLQKPRLPGGSPHGHCTARLVKHKLPVFSLPSHIFPLLGQSWWATEGAKSW